MLLDTGDNQIICLRKNMTGQQKANLKFASTVIIAFFAIITSWVPATRQTSLPIDLLSVAFLINIF